LITRKIRDICNDLKALHEDFLNVQKNLRDESEKISQIKPSKLTPEDIARAYQINEIT
jgi:hypothetical protein